MRWLVPVFRNLACCSTAYSFCPFVGPEYGIAHGAQCIALIEYVAANWDCIFDPWLGRIERFYVSRRVRLDT
ncbi:hypothetical protein F4802DRAFT_591534 [Xylaria palmicola]|nr:hypothetical protein F4802DRAFT_591534 [Xylaria palmicola]